MIESIFLWFMSAGLILLILGLELERTAYNATSILMWILVLASHFYIVIPSTTDSYWEVALLPVSLGMIIINVIIMIVNMMQRSFENKYHLR